MIVAVKVHGVVLFHFRTYYLYDDRFIQLLYMVPFYIRTTSLYRKTKIIIIKHFVHKGHSHTQGHYNLNKQIHLNNG